MRVFASDWEQRAYAALVNTRCMYFYVRRRSSGVLGLSMETQSRLTELEVGIISKAVAREVLLQLGPVVEWQRKSFVGRIEMAKLAGLSLATMDRLVAERVVSSVVVKNRRIFDGEKVLDELAKRFGVEARQERSGGRQSGSR
jgi:hypothetical protein